MQYVIKIILSALLITGISELGKRSAAFAGILSSIPVVSMLTMAWLYNDTKDVQKIIDFSNNIFWAVLPSLFFFLILPILLKSGVPFHTAMIISAIAMFIAYSVYIFILAKFGIRI
ncbi:MAG: DUF3147 family protein [Candidatus Peregrinibacteria bacterium]